MSVSKRDLKTLKMALRKFAAERDWDKFHSPKNLAMALIGETTEIVEHFQWLNEAESKRLNATKRREIQEELGDVLIYLIRLAGSKQIGTIYKWCLNPPDEPISYAFFM